MRSRRSWALAAGLGWTAAYAVAWWTLGDRAVPLMGFLFGPVLAAVLGSGAVTLVVTAVACALATTVGVLHGDLRAGALVARIGLIAGGGVLAAFLATDRDRRADETVAAQLETLQALEVVERSRHLQQALLPPSLPTSPNFALAVRYRAADGFVGGDWYDALVNPAGNLVLCSGDVAGHGVSAAVTMHNLRQWIHLLIRTHDDPGEILATLNTLLVEEAEVTMASALIGVFDLATGTLRWSRAGHPLPVVLRDGAAAPLAAIGGPMLGATPDARYEHGTTTLHRGDLLVLYSDGLIERRGESIDDGLARLVASLVAAAGPDLETTIDAVLDRCHDGYASKDDTCLLLLRLTGPDLPPDGQRAAQPTHTRVAGCASSRAAGMGAPHRSQVP